MLETSLSRSRRLRLEVMDAGGPSIHDFDGSEIWVGRDPGCDLVLQDPYVSRRHLRLLRGGDGWVAESVSRANRSFRNGGVLTRSELLPGDLLLLGDVRIRVSVWTGASPDLPARAEIEPTEVLTLPAPRPLPPSTPPAGFPALSTAPRSAHALSTAPRSAHALSTAVGPVGGPSPGTAPIADDLEAADLVSDNSLNGTLAAPIIPLRFRKVPLERLEPEPHPVAAESPPPGGIRHADAAPRSMEGISIDQRAAELRGSRHSSDFGGSSSFVADPSPNPLPGAGRELMKDSSPLPGTGRGAGGWGSWLRPAPVAVAAALTAAGPVAAGAAVAHAGATPPTRPAAADSPSGASTGASRPPSVGTVKRSPGWQRYRSPLVLAGVLSAALLAAMAAGVDLPVRPPAADAASAVSGRSGDDLAFALDPALEEADEDTLLEAGRKALGLARRLLDDEPFRDEALYEAIEQLWTAEQLLDRARTPTLELQAAHQQLSDAGMRLDQRLNDYRLELTRAQREHDLSRWEATIKRMLASVPNERDRRHVQILDEQRRLEEAVARSSRDE